MNPSLPGPTKRTIALLSLILGLGSFSIAAADSNSKRLEAIRSDISELKQSLGSDKKQQQELQHELRRFETQIADLSIKQRNTKQQLTEQQQRRKELLKEQQQLSNKHDQQQINLRQQVRAGYSAGHQQTLKLLLNQNDPAELSRTMTYYAYFSEAQSQAIKQTRDNLAEMAATEKRLTESTERLKQLNQQQEQQQRSLSEQQHNRKGVLAKLESAISSKQQRLEQLQEDERALSKLVEEIRARAAAQSQQRDLTQLKKKLKWPTRGKIKNRFGQARNETGMTWQGITIAGQAGQEIHSIAAGKVVYADWIRGYGLMLIIDHGHQYMSIYSHNESLYKDVGDTVTANELIASLGNSGGKNENALYFEIRHQGKPVNPALWCR